MPVILVKWIVAFRGCGVLRRRRWWSEARRSGPGWVRGRGRRGWPGAGAMGLGDEGIPRSV